MNLVHAGRGRSTKSAMGGEPTRPPTAHPTGLPDATMNHVSGTKKRVVVFSTYYWPEETGIAVYSTKTAEALAEAGFDVTVVTALPHYPEWRVHAQYAGRWMVEEEHGGVRVLRHRVWMPTKHDALQRGAYEASFFAFGVLRALRVPADAVLAVTPGLSTVAAGALCARVHGVKLGVIVQDLVGAAAAQSGMPSGSSVAGITGRMEASLLQRAERVVLVSEGFRRTVQDGGVKAGRIDVIRNWSHVEPPRGDRSKVRQRLGWTDSEFVVLHAGNMGYKQGLEVAVSAAADAARRGLPIRLVFMGDGNQREPLEAAASDLPNVNFLDPQPADLFADVLAAADVLLVCERPTVKNMSLPSKLTSYFSVGRPVIASVADDGLTAHEVRAARGGIVVSGGDPQALTRGVQKLQQDPELCSRLSSNGVEYVRTRLSGQRATSALISVVEDLFGEGA
jgi:colanic acid biosynthesis glycosyl transferase WcaI